MKTKAELLTEYNELSLLFDDISPLEMFDDKMSGISLVKGLKQRIEAAKTIPTKDDLTPKRGLMAVQLPLTLTRQEALEEGLVLYWNGSPCSREHVSVRYTQSGWCKKCYQLFRGEEIDQTEICKEKLPEERRRKKE